MLTNGGTIAGDVSGGAHIDVFTNTGSVGGTINLFGGADRFVGGSKSEILNDWDGADSYSLGGGDDTYHAVNGTGSDGIDTVDGGAGIDTYDASAATNTLYINLGATAYPAFGMPGFRAWGVDVSDEAWSLAHPAASYDAITGFENAIGGAGGDIIIGSADANVLDGVGGADHLMGLAGDDSLQGKRLIDYMGAQEMIGSRGAMATIFCLGIGRVLSLRMRERDRTR